MLGRGAEGLLGKVTAGSPARAWGEGAFLQLRRSGPGTWEWNLYVAGSHHKSHNPDFSPGEQGAQASITQACSPAAPNHQSLLGEGGAYSLSQGPIASPLSSQSPKSSPSPIHRNGCQAEEKPGSG